MLQGFLNEEAGILDSEASLQDLRDALLYRIIAELINLKSFYGLSKREFRKHLGFFNMIFEHNVGQFPPKSPQFRLFGELCTHILAFLQSQKMSNEQVYHNKNEYQLSRIIVGLLMDWIRRNFDTSDELKKLNRKLWEKNRQHGKLFRNRLRNRRERVLRNYEVRARRNLTTTASAARSYYLKGLQNISNKRNYIFTRGAFEELCQEWEQLVSAHAKMEKEVHEELRRALPDVVV